MSKLKGTGKVMNKTADAFYGDTNNKPYYQRIVFNSNEIPELDGLEPGKEITLKIKARLKTKIDEEDKSDGTFEILAVKVAGDDFENAQQKYYKEMLS